MSIFETLKSVQRKQAEFFRTITRKLVPCKVCGKEFLERDPVSGFSNIWCSDKCAQSTVN